MHCSNNVLEFKEIQTPEREGILVHTTSSYCKILEKIGIVGIDGGVQNVVETDGTIVSTQDVDVSVVKHRFMSEALRGQRCSKDRTIGVAAVTKLSVAQLRHPPC